jgi:thiol-disulfide isomerase/thioredoxin
MLRFIISFIFLVTACGPSTVSVSDSAGSSPPSPITWDECSQDVGDHPCNIELTDQNGNLFSLYENFGKIIILDFSAEWCPPCQSAAAEVQSTQDANSDLVYVTILIETDEGLPPSTEDCGEWADRFGITSAPVLAGSRDLIRPEGWPITSWPTFFFITKDMTVNASLKGFGSEHIKTLIEDTRNQ